MAAARAVSHASIERGASIEARSLRPRQSAPSRSRTRLRRSPIMTAAVSQYDMEYTKTQMWLAALALLAAGIGVVAGAGVGRKPTGSILDIIDQDRVQRILEERRRAEQATNELGDGSSEAVVINIPPDNDESTELPTGIDYRKVLKSSKNALYVTKKEYLKEDWCKTEPIVQKIREPGCLPATVLNKFCYGQCNSFYIPKGPRRRNGSDERPQPAFKSCSFCRPRKLAWVTVRLRCPGLNPPYRHKRLQTIKQCKCMPVGVN